MGAVYSKKSYAYWQEGCCATSRRGTQSPKKIKNLREKKGPFRPPSRCSHLVLLLKRCSTGKLDRKVREQTHRGGRQKKKKSPGGIVAPLAKGGCTEGISRGRITGKKREGEALRSLTKEDVRQGYLRGVRP